MTRSTRFEKGDVDHIRIVSGSTYKDQVLECGVCKEQFDPRDGAWRRRRFAERHWKVQHVKCKKGEAS